MLSPEQVAQVEGWLERYSGIVADLDANTTAAVLIAYQQIGDWQDPAETLAAAAMASGAAQAGQQAAAEAAAQFAAISTAVLRETGISTVPVVGEPTYLRNADPFAVYSRPVFTYREAIEAGATALMAQQLAFERAAQLAETDTMLGRRYGSVTQLRRDGVERYRRVIRPELSKTGVCGLCVAASSQLYYSDDLLPIHTRCKCEVIAVNGEDDIAGAFNLADMERLYRARPVASTARRDLSRTRYTVEDLAELGPTLTPAA